MEKASDRDLSSDEARREVGSSAPDGNDVVNATMEKVRTTRVPWVANVQTGWAAKQEIERGQGECHHCGEAFADCEGCGDLRCLRCEPYLSDDCRWTI